MSKNRILAAALAAVLAYQKTMAKRHSKHA